MVEKPHTTKLKVLHPGLFAFFGALALSFFSIFQKSILGAPPFIPTGFIVPVLFGGIAGGSIGILFRQIRRNHQKHCQALEKSTDQLRTSEDMFRMLAENARDILFRWNLAEFRYEYISPAVHSITGYSPEEFMNNPSFFKSILFAGDLEIINNLFEDGGPPKTFVEYRVIHKDGQTVWINQRNAIHRDQDGKAIYLEGIATDITAIIKAREEKKLLYRQLNQSQKLESVGRLAGGIAHDFNNLLTVINGYSELVLEALDSGDPRYSEVQQIQTAGLKASNLTSQLLSFSRDQMEEPRILNLVPVMQDFMTMLRRIIGAGITVDLHIKEPLPMVLLDPVHFDQIILNLVINARDAMMNNGHLGIAMSEATMDGQECDQCGKAMFGKFVRLTVTDTGRGISEDVLERIFDPFFTTKKAGQGTGLGLATVIELVLQYKGHIQIDTTLGKGTTFNILFPSTTAENISDAEILETPNTRDLCGIESILLVEDEGLIRSLTQTLLEQYGYKVFVAADGEAGMEIFNESSKSIDMLLTDIMMPGMDGRELYQQACAIKPSLKILFMSGFTDSIEMDGAPANKDLHFLAKPFGALELALKVRKVLDC